MHRIENNLNLINELPSIALLTLSYASFFAATLYVDQIGLWVALLLLVPALVLHSSLQHEFIHGHPTSSHTFNDFLVSAPISLFVPYLRFKDTHLAHHFDPNLTDPYDDPESNFLNPKVWENLPGWRKTISNFNNTLAGRTLIGPLIGIMSFYRGDLIELCKLNSRIWLSYVHHAIGLVIVMAYMNEFSILPIWVVVVAAYMSMSILKIRTFLEHKAHERVAARTVIIEDKGPLALLFLNNNFHSIHHSYPKLVWHKLPAKFYERKDDFLKRNGGYWFSSYWSVFRYYFFARKDPVPHPLMNVVEPKDSNPTTAKSSLGAVGVKH